MNGPEHYREAESSLEAAWDRDTEDSRRILLLADAQVHATLALAAATAASRTAWSNPADNYTATYVDGEWSGVTQ